VSSIVHLVRHGKVYNPGRILYGRLPGYHLSDRGRAMASATADSFAGHDVTLLAHSPLTRAEETAQPIAQVTGQDPEAWEDIIEAGNRFEGLRVNAWNSQLWNPVRWPLLKDPSIPSWGEPYEQIATRMLSAAKKAAEIAEGHEAILVSHELPIVMVQRSVAGLPLPHNPARRKCALASVTSLHYCDGEILDIYYSEPAQEI